MRHIRRTRCQGVKGKVGPQRTSCDLSGIGTARTAAAAAAAMQARRDGGSTSSSGSTDGGTDTTPTGDSACGAEADLNGCVSCLVAQGGSCYDSVAAACQKNADCTANQGCLQSQCASKQ
jgi:hypothetical protein